jgi:hypothetical protein
VKKAHRKREREENEYDRVLRIREEANKSLWWMPRRQMPTKDVGHCEKPRGAVYRRRSGDVRMGKPATANLWHRLSEHIG